MSAMLDCDRTETNRFDTDDTWMALYYRQYTILIVSNRDPATREEIANDAIEVQSSLEKLYEMIQSRRVILPVVSFRSSY